LIQSDAEVESHVESVERAVDDALYQLYGRTGVDGFWASRRKG
jgi:hypothetical protein